MTTHGSLRVIAATLLAACLAAPALANNAPHGHGEYGPHGGAQMHYDTRHQHNQYYPVHGAPVHALPHGAYAVPWHGGNYWYHGGIWYAPYGPSWVVVAPPIGIYVPFLPPFYTTVWFGGIPYYYANDAYYVWHEQERSYEVVDPPGSSGPSTQPPAPADVFMYPRAGQTPEQQDRDRYECHRWAADQTGFDPTRPEGGVPVSDAAVKRADYFRAMTACLEGRGYSVK
jgi:hypothetical protein